MTRDAASAAAVQWVIAQRDPAFSDWEAFIAWMEADPAHAGAYHEAALLDADLGQLPAAPMDAPAPPVANDDEDLAPVSRPFGRRALLSGAIAASLIAMVGYQLIDTAPQTYRVETALGETRMIALADGSSIAVNGGSALVLSHKEPRQAKLERGQALFHVVHSDTDPFIVMVGEARLVDLGTIFDVTRTGSRTVVAVSEGAVAYNSEGANLRVDAGKRLAVDEATRDAGITRVELAAVGGWSSGQLVYDGVPLDEVAGEISRTTGITLRTDAAAGAVRFRGALRTDGDEVRMVEDLAALSGTRAKQDAGGWTLTR